MVNSELLEELSARVLEVPRDAGRDEVMSAYRDKVSEWHPDTSDDPQAREKFMAADTARDILLGNLDFSDPDRVDTAESVITELFSKTEVEELEEETEHEAGYRSTAEARQDPTQYTKADFAQASGEERRELLKEIALGVETVIIFESVNNLYEMDYEQGDFFEDVNEYIGEARSDTIDFDDYYQATRGHLRDGVTEDLFVESCRKIQNSLQGEYGEGATIREVARIVAYFMVEGGINIGNFGRFVGDSPFGRDGPFTREHPLGRHGRKRRGDPRFTRGDDRYTR